MKPSIASVKVQLDIDAIGTRLVEAIEKLISKRNPELAYLYAEFTNTPGIQVEMGDYGCWRYVILLKGTKISILDPLIYTALGELATDEQAMRRLAYWISLLDVEKNVRIKNGNLEQTQLFLIRLGYILKGFYEGNDKLVHKGIKG